MGARDTGAVPVSVFEQAGPVFDSHDDVTRVDEVEVVWGVQPGTFDVINEKSNIGRHPLRLNRGEVHPEDAGFGMLVAHCAC